MKNRIWRVHEVYSVIQGAGFILEALLNYKKMTVSIGIVVLDLMRIAQSVTGMFHESSIDAIVLKVGELSANATVVLATARDP